MLEAGRDSLAQTSCNLCRAGARSVRVDIHSVVWPSESPREPAPARQLARYQLNLISSLGPIASSAFLFLREQTAPASWRYSRRRDIEPEIDSSPLAGRSRERAQATSRLAEGLEFHLNHSSAGAHDCAGATPFHAAREGSAARQLARKWHVHQAKVDTTTPVAPPSGRRERTKTSPVRSRRSRARSEHRGHIWA